MLSKQLIFTLKRNNAFSSYTRRILAISFIKERLLVLKMLELGKGTWGIFSSEKKGGFEKSWLVYGDSICFLHICWSST